jgi:hypothetical protein
MAKQTVNFAVVGFTEAEAATIAAHVPGPASNIEKMSQVSASLLRDLLKGGTMVPGEWGSRIESAIGSLDPEKIVEAVEKSAGRSWDSVRVEWVPDATHLAFYKQLADANGITLEHELKTLLDFAYSQGWFGMAAPDPFKILLTPEQFRTLQEMFGKDIPTGADVMEKIQQAFALAPLPAAAPADDFGLGAL